MFGKKKKVYPDDDGRTICDMSGIGANRFEALRILPRFKRRGDAANSPSGAGSRDIRAEANETDADIAESASPREELPPLTRGFKAGMALGTLRAALFVCACFLVPIGLFIWLLTLVW